MPEKEKKSFRTRLRNWKNYCLEKFIESHGVGHAWYPVAMGVIIFCVVLAFTAMNIATSTSSVSRLLAERGAALVAIFESSLRSSMRNRSSFGIQNLLEELVNREDILFLAITTPEGEILAHNDSSRIGQFLQIETDFATPNGLTDLGVSAEPSWKLLRMEGKKAFVVYQSLTKVNALLSPGAGSSKDILSKWSLGRLFPPPEHLTNAEKTLFLSISASPVIAFVGQNPRPLEILVRQNVNSALLSGGLIFLSSLAALISIHAAGRMRESRRRMHNAENVAQCMVNEVERLEQEMRRREKLAAIGDLAAGVAHELRNPLSSIKGYATFFSQRFPAGSDEREAALVMVQETERLNRVVTDLIGVSKPTDIQPKQTDLGQLVDSVLLLMSQDAQQQGVKLRREGEAQVSVDADRLRQALLNICLNAVEAMPHGGDLEIRLAEDGEKIVLDAEDNGQGIDQEFIGRIFDPYFTTKNQGTGLGLATTLKIVEAHGGSMSVSSKLGQGTLIRIILPKQAAQTT